MREAVFEALAPLCPRCLHVGNATSPLRVADRGETREGHLWHGLLHCTAPPCWMEFPVIDGVPLMVADPRAFVQVARWQIMARDPLPEGLAGALGDALGPDGEHGVTRHHLSLYAGSHYDDWAGGEDESSLAGIVERGLAPLGALAGPALDIGGSVGRGAWTLAAAGAAPGVVGDMNFAMLRLGQALAATGRASFDRRRVGVVFDRAEIVLPPGLEGTPPEFWAMDATALPFADATFATTTAINLIDCVAGPTQAVAEMGRVLRPGGGAVVTTPYDWSTGATEMAQWLGGHSQRTDWRGAAEPVLAAVLEQAGLEVLAEEHAVPWRLRIHARSVMDYSLHMVTARRRNSPDAPA